MMKANIFRKTVLGVFTLLLASFTSSALAQDSKMIEEVKIVNNDNFKELKSLLEANFDYQDVDANTGIYTSELKFDIDENGQVENITTNGSNNAVNAEIKETIEELKFKFNNGLNKNANAYSYVMPIELILED